MIQSVIQWVRIGRQSSKGMLAAVLLWCLGGGFLRGQEGPDHFLRDLEGRSVHQREWGPGPKVVVFLSPDCPLCQNYSRVLNRLSDKFEGKVLVVGVFPGMAHSREEYRQFREKYRIRFPLVTDTGKILVGKLGAKVTPEAFLMDGAGRTIYCGAIDNWVVELGVKRAKPTVHFLADAIETYLGNPGAAVAPTEAVGCFIGDL